MVSQDSGQMSRDIWTLLALEVFEPPTFGFRSPPMELDRVKTELSVQYVDHNLLEADERNTDDHLFLYSACRRGAPGGAGQCASSARTAVPSCSSTVGRPSRRAATSLARSVALAGQAAYA